MNSPSINAKLKAMYAKKLKKEDLEDLMKQNNIKDAIIILKTKINNLNELPNNARRMELENALDNNIIDDIKKINKYLKGNDKEIWKQYIMKFKIKIIKALYESLITKEAPNITDTVWIDNLFLDLKPLLNAENAEDFIEQIPNKQIKNIFKNTNSSFERENKLDKFYLENLLKAVRNKNKIIEKALKQKIDLLNIVWTYRCTKYYGITNQDYLINNYYRINKDIINEIEKAENIDELKQILDTTIYKGVIQNDIEKDIKKFNYNINKRIFRNKTLDLSMVIGYFNMIEIEKESVITIIEGIRYKLPQIDIERKIII